LNSPCNVNAVIFTRWREWSGLCHGHFTPGKSTPSTHSIEHFEEEWFLVSCQKSNTESLGNQPIGKSLHQVSYPISIVLQIIHIICALLVETSLQLNVWHTSSVRTRQRMVSCMWKLATAHTSFWLKVDLLTLKVCLFVCVFVWLLLWPSSFSPPFLPPPPPPP